MIAKSKRRKPSCKDDLLQLMMTGLKGKKMKISELKSILYSTRGYTQQAVMRYSPFQAQKRENIKKRIFTACYCCLFYAITIYGLFVAIIVPAAIEDRPTLICIAVAVALSCAFGKRGGICLRSYRLKYKEIKYI